MKGIQIFFKSPFFICMATASKVDQPIPIFLADLVPLDVDVVPIKFHQFFMKLCRNIHRSVWQLLGVVKIQNGGRCHGKIDAEEKSGIIIIIIIIIIIRNRAKTICLTNFIWEP
jgi:hypothetical protein